MLKRNSKKGFTLAELLIVVAIIAVLVAIAVPLFVGGLQKAQDATYTANARAVKAEAAVKILTGNKEISEIFKEGNNVYAVATVSNTDGKISDLQIKYGDKEETCTTDYASWKAAGWVITVQLEEDDIDTAGLTENPKGE